MKEIVATQQLWTPAPRYLARQVLLLSCLTLVGCASTNTMEPLPTGPESWKVVIGLSHGSNVTITIDCVASEHEACEVARRQTGSEDQSPRVLVGTHIQADADSILIRREQQTSTVLLLPREIVVTVEVDKRDSRITGLLIGMATGIGLCTAAGLYAEHDIVASGKVFLTAACAGGGAALGYAIDSNEGQPQRRLIFQRRSPALRSF